MASLSREDNGTWRVLFVCPVTGKRKTIRLSKDLPKKGAEAYKDHIGCLVTFHNNQKFMPVETLEWVLTLNEIHYDRIADAGLLDQREKAQPQVYSLHALIEDVRAGLLHKKPNTKKNYERTFALLLEKFGAGKAVAVITTKDADGFVDWLRNEKAFARATVSLIIKKSRYTFDKAVRWDLIEKNPFGGIKVGSGTNPERQAYVPMEVFETILTHTQEKEFRAILALCRIAAVRCPSEIVTLRWRDVQWEKRQLRITSPKTEGYEGKDHRIVPLFPRLHELLRELYESESRDPEFVVSCREPGINWRKKLNSLIKLAKLEVWPKLFHNLRASRESELYRQYPLDTVCKWLGHNPATAALHYLHDPNLDGSFQRAITEGRTEQPSKKPAHNPAHEDSEVRNKLGSSENSKHQKRPEKQHISGEGSEDLYLQRESNPCLRRERASS